MKNVFIVSDQHFGHANICKFLREDGTKLRPWDDVAEMDEHLVKVHNEKVKPTDKVYFLGDVLINRRAFSTIGRLNGDKVLVRGNHDIFPDDEYQEYFRALRAYHVLSGMILSHIPVHPDSLGRFGVNIHGHLHANRVKKARGVDVKTGTVLYSDMIDPRYHCVCVEQLPDFAPIALEELTARIRDEGGVDSFRPNKSYMM
jgi:calcineurin-like phosphoesterase family protein